MKLTWKVDTILSTIEEEVALSRLPNTTSSGQRFDAQTVDLVWAKAQPNLWFVYFKKDSCGATIKKDDFGKNTEFGWEIDHILPIAKGGTDHLDNLQPLHWENNRHKGDDHPEWSCTRRT